MRKHQWRSALCGAMAVALAAMFAPAIAGAQPEEQPSGKKQQGQGQLQGSTGQQQQGQVGGNFDEPYLWGAFDSTTTDANDWFYDSYSYTLYQRDWTDVPWYNQPSSFSGLYNDNLADNDWFYDSYGPSTGQQNDPFMR